MYILKNALRCIGRAKGRNILIGLIALVIAVSACIGLSIRQAAESAKESALEDLTVTATISLDRGAMMGNMSSSGSEEGGGRGGFDKNQFANMMGKATSLTLEEYQKYASAESVSDFYYTLSAYFDGSDAFSPVSTELDESFELDGELTEQFPEDGIPPELPEGMEGGTMGGMMGGRGESGEFTLVGYSSYSAMIAFVSGNASILEGGSMFDEDGEEYVCVISEELAIFNGLSVGDSVVITNPKTESETYTLLISGIYTSAQTNDASMRDRGFDPANQIYMSAAALNSILDASDEASSIVIDSTTGRENETRISGTLSPSYVFASPEDYYAFEEQARALGLDESYSISSADVSSFERSLTPLNTLSTIAGWFLLVILAIGAIILVVVNIFNVRDRKYEVGVLTAMGMKKWRVATQFICETLAVTMVAVVIGAGIGALSSVPVTNTLLESQIESQAEEQSQIESNFGRPTNREGNFTRPQSNSERSQSEASARAEAQRGAIGGATAYISEVNSAMNLTVALQMIGVGLLLTVVASAVSVLFIMRYDPLKILANRD